MAEVISRYKVVEISITEMLEIVRMNNHYSEIYELRAVEIATCTKFFKLTVDQEVFAIDGIQESEMGIVTKFTAFVKDLENCSYDYWRKILIDNSPRRFGCERFV